MLLSIFFGTSTRASVTTQGEVPQFVSITFDDNFGLAAPGAVGGVRAIVRYFAGKRNPAAGDTPPILTAFR